MTDPTWPGETLITVSPSDSTTYTPAIRQLYIGTAGDVTVTTLSNTTITFKGVGAGSTIGPFFVSKVNAATSATDIIAFI